jgi:hypothetical protein
MPPHTNPEVTGRRLFEPPHTKAKKTSADYARCDERHGEDVFRRKASALVAGASPILTRPIESLAESSWLSVGKAAHYEGQAEQEHVPHAPACTDGESPLSFVGLEDLYGTVITMIARRAAAILKEI